MERGKWVGARGGGLALDLRPRSLVPAVLRAQPGRCWSHCQLFETRQVREKNVTVGAVREAGSGKDFPSFQTLLPAIGGAAGLAWAASALAESGVPSLEAIPGIEDGGPALGGFISAFLLILFSEIGDKTFFIAVLLSLQNPKSAVFIGTVGALAVMTVISTGLGQVLHELDGLLPASTAAFPLDDVLAISLLVFFGLQTLLAAGDADDTAKEEKEEAEEVVSGLLSGANGLILSTFVLVFAAEWGDKSFLATTALAAVANPINVCIGAVAGHAVATVIAVVGGSFLSEYVSERTVQYIGGSLFLVFAAFNIFELVEHIS
ncbi:unnamed protein product [Ostreobium quekettii]|uniref:GDT1 family protein n=1 Tax=Ostreobium quekettii TaxID=121088 RepID=A0A8S1ITK9_9CHLO|nr:unnamed protein product [Ostreobium quekettii]|eukprot:evm.model.scf_723.4 EVM.evm.TU.scf_723.4   scf_723:25179-28734(-)